MIKVFLESLYTKNRSLWDKVKHEVDYPLRVATAGSEEARKIEKAKKVLRSHTKKRPQLPRKNTLAQKGLTAETKASVYHSILRKALVVNLHKTVITDTQNEIGSDRKQ